MRILVIGYMYLPDGGPAAPLYAMLCEELAKRGHCVTVIASVPHYPSGQVQPNYRRKCLHCGIENGVQVIRVPLPSVDRTNLRKRFLQFISFQLGATWAGLRCRYDAVIIGNPALVFWLPFKVLSALRRKPTIASVHDLYPDVGITLNIFRQRPVIEMVTALERSFLKGSVYVRVLSESFIPPLRRLGVSDNKMKLIYDWVDTDLIRPLSRKNPFSHEHGLDDKFVVLYAGNIGLSQGLEYVIDTAEILKKEKKLIFVFVGDGAGRKQLGHKATRKGLVKVKFLPFQPRVRLPEVLATADISLVTLRKGVATASLPSKSFSILASGRPLIASVDKDSDTWKLAQRSGAGICIPPENPEALAEAIMELKNDPSRRMLLSHNGREFALKNHSPQAAAEKFEQLLLSAISAH